MNNWVACSNPAWDKTGAESFLCGEGRGLLPFVMSHTFLSGMKTTIKQFCCKSLEVKEKSQLNIGRYLVTLRVTH
jgi:hypothetical protein